MTGSRAVIIVAGILLLLQLIDTTRSLIYTALHDSVATVKFLLMHGGVRCQQLMCHEYGLLSIRR